MTQVSIDSIVKRWTDPSARPLLKGKLIDGSGCCCAQGDVLRCAGWTDEQLRKITQENADAKVAEILDISRGHAVLLRIVNDRSDGCPQEVLTNPEKVIGPNARYVWAFFRHIDALGADGWKKVAAAADAAVVAAWNDAVAAGWVAARSAAGADAADAARAAAEVAANAARTLRGTLRGVAAWVAAGAAARAATELVGINLLASPFFLKFFFDDVPAWLASVDAQ